MYRSMQYSNTVEVNQNMNRVYCMFISALTHADTHKVLHSSIQGFAQLKLSIYITNGQLVTEDECDSEVILKGCEYQL